MFPEELFEIYTGYSDSGHQAKRCTELIWPIKIWTPMNISPDLTIQDMLKLASDHKDGTVPMPEEDCLALIAMIKERAQDELEYGEEMIVGSARIVKRVTGAVSVFFGKL